MNASIKDEEYEPAEEEIQKLASAYENEDKRTNTMRAKIAAENLRKVREVNRKSKKERGQRMAALHFHQERIKDLKKQIPDRIKCLEAESLKWDAPIAAKKQQISELRTKISELTVRWEAKDDKFHIDESRDEQGHTFLMVSAMNNDIETARLCFELKANPNAKSSGGLTAMTFAFFFKFVSMVDLIAQNGGTYPNQQVEVWKPILSAGRTKSESVVNWDTALRISDQAAIPTETVLRSASALEESEDSRMIVLTEEQRKRDFVFFDTSIVDGQMNSNNMRRVVLLSKDAYQWFLDSGTPSKSNFLEFLDSLKPVELRQQSRAKGVECNRRAVVGMKKTYEVLCAPLAGNKADSQVCLFTPFVSSAIEGVTDVGVLGTSCWVFIISPSCTSLSISSFLLSVWTITVDMKASLYKTLIESTDFLRHKVDDDEQFPLHEKDVLELGKDLILLDLQSTSIFTSKPLELYTLDVDQGDIERLDTGQYAPKKRIAYYEEQLNRAVFDASEEEAKDNKDILSGERAGMSTSLVGGAGTGKTLLMTKKIVSVTNERKILVVSRLPRLVAVIKRAVEHERDDVSNVTFMTYDDLLALLARSVTPSTESEELSFSTFCQVHFGRTEAGADSSISFLDGFVGEFLGPKERKVMKAGLVQPMTLWTAFRTIKSSARSSLTKKPLTRDEYMKLPISFGLRSEQRKLVYDLYLRYEEVPMASIWAVQMG